MLSNKQTQKNLQQSVNVMNIDIKKFEDLFKNIDQAMKYGMKYLAFCDETQ